LAENSKNIRENKRNIGENGDTILKNNKTVGTKIYKAKEAIKY